MPINRWFYLGHVGEPLQDIEDSLKVVTNGGVGHTIVVHDLNPTKLVVRCVHFSAQHLSYEKGKKVLKCQTVRHSALA